jgi:large subunit ribosomal protein L6
MMPVAGRTERTVELPDGVTVAVNDRTVTVKGPNGELTRTFPTSRIQIALEGKVVKLVCTLPKKRENALLGTFAAHIRNMVRGVSKGFEYKMKIVYSHFPVKASVKNDEFVIENFLGEKHPRRAKIMGSTKIVVKGDEVTLTGPDKEHVGQSAANIEQATAIKGYDPRVFQDGIYITSKGGVTDA